MFAIAKNSTRSHGRTIGMEEWFKQYISEFNDGTFIIRDITRHIPKGFHLAKIDVGDIENKNQQIDIFFKYVDRTIKIKDILILPFGVPSSTTQIHFYKSMLCYSYIGDFDGKNPNDEVVCTMMFALIQHAIYKLSRMDINLPTSDEHHYIKIIVSLFHTMKKFMETSIIFSNLIHSLAQCSEPKDVLQREIAVILDNQPMTGTFFQQTLCLSFARKIEWFKKTGNRGQVSLAGAKEFAGINAIFSIAPLLKISVGYTPENIDRLLEKMRACQHAFSQIHTKESLRQDDSKFIVSGQICHTVVTNMVNIIGVTLPVPKAEWFAGKLLEVQTYGFTFRRTNDICVVNYVPVSILIDKRGHMSRNISYVNGKFSSPTITEWASFEITMNNNEILEIVHENLAVSTTFSGDTRGIQDNVANINFLGKCKNTMTQLCYNSQGSYSPLTNQLFDPDSMMYISTKPIQFPIKLYCRNGNIDVLSHTNEQCFHIFGNTVVIALKNVALQINIPKDMDTSIESVRKSMATLFV